MVSAEVAEVGFDLRRQGREQPHDEGGTEILAQRIETDQAVALVGKIIDYYRANAKPKERMGRMIERLGLDHMEEALGLGSDA